MRSTATGPESEQHCSTEYHNRKPNISMMIGKHNNPLLLFYRYNPQIFTDLYLETVRYRGVPFVIVSTKDHALPNGGGKPPGRVEIIVPDDRVVRVVGNATLQTSFPYAFSLFASHRNGFVDKSTKKGYISHRDSLSLESGETGWFLAVLRLLRIEVITRLAGASWTPGFVHFEVPVLLDRGSADTITG